MIMDNPGASLFQDADLKLNNSQNNEEEEDLEDQRRRNEELQDLLVAKLDDFNYDESTINSSNNASIISLDEIQNKYRNTNPNEQLKVLYDVRLRELNNLRMEHEAVKQEMSKEVDALRKKNLICEAELKQNKVSLKNANELLVEKTSTINELLDKLHSKEEQIRNNEKVIDSCRLEISTYQSTINDLQQQFQTVNPFNREADRFNAEEFQKAHQEKIDRLESLLEEQIIIAKKYDKEKLIKQAEIQKLIEQQAEDRNTINTLSKNFDSAQKQCEELIDVIECLTKENKHLQDRVDVLYENSPDLGKKTYDSNNLDQMEKLKKMLLDKSVQIDSLNLKLKNYENNMKELLEYRQLKNDVYKTEFQECENKQHTKSLLLMQNDLQNYRRTIEDKNQQILTLNSTNRDLLEKMEEMLSQTRNDIEKFSHKYNLPQLEKMTVDLSEAEQKIRELEDKLKRSEDRRLSLVQKIKKPEKKLEKDLKEKLDLLELNNEMKEKEMNNCENQLKKLQKEFDISLSEIASLKQYIENLVSENTRLIAQLQDKKNESEHCDENLRKQLLEAVQKLQESENKTKILEETIDELTRLKTISDGEKCTYQCQATDYKNQLENTLKILEDIKINQQETLTTLEEREKHIKKLQLFVKNTESELVNLRRELASKEAALKLATDAKNELTDLLQKANTELEATKEELFHLQNKEVEVTENNVRRNLEKELEAAEKQEDSANRTEAVDVLTMEIKLREELQEEYFEKLKEIEKKYKRVCASSNDLYKKQADIVKNQENKFREYIATIVNECTQKIKDLEDDRENLIMQINILRNNFDAYKTQATRSEDAIKNVLKKAQLENREISEKWTLWSRGFVNNCLKIESITKKTGENILNKMQAVDSEVAAIEKSYNEKIKKYVKNCKLI